MKFWRYYSVLFFCIFVYLNDFSQQNSSIRFSHLTTKDGLCSPNILAFTRTKKVIYGFALLMGYNTMMEKISKLFTTTLPTKTALDQI